MVKPFNTEFLEYLKSLIQAKLIILHLICDFEASRFEK